MLFFILLSILLFFFCLYLFFDNKKLKEKVEILEVETKKILERKLTNNKEDLISIENISVDDSCKKMNEINCSSKEQVVKNQELGEKYSEAINLKSEVDLKKYVARANDVEYKELKIQNPMVNNLPLGDRVKDVKEVNLNISSKEKIIVNSVARGSGVNNISLSKDFNPAEFIKRDIVGIDAEDNDNNEYLQEIARQLENELVPKTIELTDYEKKQEEQAVISYQELLSLKEKLKNQSNQDKNFLEDLKDLRKLLD